MKLPLAAAAGQSLLITARRIGAAGVSSHTPRMAHLTAQRLKVTWSQTTDALDFTFAIPGAEGDEPKYMHASDDKLKVEWPPVSFAASFAKPVRGTSAQWKVVHRGKMQVQIKKEAGYTGGWSHPFTELLPYVFKNWDKWDPDLDDDQHPHKGMPRADDVAEQLGGLRPPSEAADATEDGSPVFEASPLYLAGGDQGDDGVDLSEHGPQAGADVSDPSAGDGARYAWLREWGGFRIEQRMVVMACFWNAMEAPTKIIAARRLITILQDDAALNQLEAAVKGGNFARLKLDPSVYDGVPRPARWHASFAAMGSGEQVGVMELCFSALPYDEKKVCASPHTPAALFGCVQRRAWMQGTPDGMTRRELTRVRSSRARSTQVIVATFM